jgi:hypothetical protein
VTLGNFFILSSFHLASVGCLSGPNFRRKTDPNLGVWAPHGLPPHLATWSLVPPHHPKSRLSKYHQPEGRDWPFDHPNLKCEILGSTDLRSLLYCKSNQKLYKMITWSIGWIPISFRRGGSTCFNSIRGENPKVEGANPNVRRSQWVVGCAPPLKLGEITHHKLS